MIYGKDKWGPKAWYLLHIFSFNNNKKIIENKKHNYYLFYTTFSYILPCIICSDHYADLIYNKLPIKEELITKNYLKRWIYNIHNKVNKILKKPKYSIDDFKNKYKNIENINGCDIYFFIDTIYSNFDYKMMSLYKYDNILTFFINFCILYPNNIVKTKLKKLINSKEFKEVNTPLEFKTWYMKNKLLIEIIIKEIDNK